MASSGVRTSIRMEGIAPLQAALSAAPKDCRADFRKTAKKSVTEPAAHEIKAAAAGNRYITMASVTTRAMSGATPTIKVGTTRRVASGGLTAGQAAIMGAFGGNRNKVVTYHTKRGSVTRHTARQTPMRAGGDGRWFIPRFKEAAPRLIEQWTEVFTTFLAKWGN